MTVKLLSLPIILWTLHGFNAIIARSYPEHRPNFYWITPDYPPWVYRRPYTYGPEVRYTYSGHQPGLFFTSLLGLEKS